MSILSNNISTADLNEMRSCNVIAIHSTKMRALMGDSSKQINVITRLTSMLALFDNYGKVFWLHVAQDGTEASQRSALEVFYFTIKAENIMIHSGGHNVITDRLMQEFYAVVTPMRNLIARYVQMIKTAPEGLTLEHTIVQDWLSTVQLDAYAIRDPLSGVAIAPQKRKPRGSSSHGSKKQKIDSMAAAPVVATDSHVEKDPVEDGLHEQEQEQEQEDAMIISHDDAITKAALHALQMVTESSYPLAEPPLQIAVE